jgi:hypothetical protein
LGVVTSTFLDQVEREDFDKFMHGCVSSEGWHVQQGINLPG